jgi:Fur family ferric uptake transcriptional regulator
MAMAKQRQTEGSRTEKEIFYESLQRKGLKRTAQRDLILDVFLDARGHHSIEELYERVKAVDASVGFTTVYRTLKLLVEYGLAHQVQFGDGYTRYEQGFHYSHHDHLICVECGESTEFFSERLEAVQDEIVRRHGFQMVDHSLRIWGVCQNCQPKRAKSQTASAKSALIRTTR